MPSKEEAAPTSGAFAKGAQAGNQDPSSIAGKDDLCAVSILRWLDSSFVEAFMLLTTIWVGLMAPKGTPKVVIDKLNEALNAALRQPELKQQWSRQGATPMVMSPSAFDKFLQDDIAKWSTVIKSAGIKMD